MPESRPRFAALKRRFDRRAATCARFALGTAEVDAALGGGLPRARLHEAFAAGPDDIASALGFALMLAMAAAAGGAIVLIMQDGGVGRIHPPGLAELGADPSAILFVSGADEAAMLRAAADIVRSPGVGAMVAALPGPAPRLDLTASRRLALAAERSGVTPILARGAVPPAPSAAASRWRVAAALSTVLEADAPGHPAFDLELLRHRTGLSRSRWRLEWDRDARHFRTPLPGAAPAEPALGQLAG